MPHDHPLRKTRMLIDAVLATMDADLAAIDARQKRPPVDTAGVSAPCAAHPDPLQRALRELVGRADRVQPAASQVRGASRYKGRRPTGFRLSPPSMAGFRTR
jgi:hypothetical protein